MTSLRLDRVVKNYGVNYVIAPRGTALSSLASNIILETKEFIVFVPTTYRK